MSGLHKATLVNRKLSDWLLHGSLVTRMLLNHLGVQLPLSKHCIEF